MDRYFFILTTIDLFVLGFMCLLTRLSESLNKKQKRGFLLAFALIACISVLEVITIVVDGAPLGYRWLNILSNYLGFGLTPAVPLCLVYVLDKKSIIRRGFKAAVCCEGAYLLFLAATLPYGLVFSVSRENLYARGEYFYIYVAMYYAAMLYLMVATVRTAAAFQNRSRMLIYPLTLFLGTETVIQLALPELHVTWLCVTLLSVLYYIYCSEMWNQLDALTGLLNQNSYLNRTAEMRRSGGVLVVFDVDDFKQINDRYGHLIGDALLCEAARTLRDIFFPRDIIGRVGGDEFIIYILGGCSQEAVDGRAAQLAERLRKAGRRYGMQWNLSFTLGLAEKQAGDDYISLFDRADQMLLARKKARRARRADSADAGGERSICTDMALIRRELREKDPPKGAFCQDYETFKQIYRFVERGLKRSGQSAYIILMTLTDAQGQFVPLAAREEYMSRLSDDLQASLRSGDLFAPYSGCQYLLMVLGASSENAAVIAGRIHTRFMSRVAPDAGLLLRYDVYPMGELPLQPKG